jgi:hypothetical protein
MLGVVINESERIKNILEGNYDREDIGTTLKLLIKHYYLEGMTDKLQLREQLLNFLKNTYEGYKRAKWEDRVTSMVDYFLKTVRRNKLDVRIIDIKEIHITKQELEDISKLNNIRLEKLAFVALVYAKISNITMNNTDGWINKSCSMICKEARVSLKGIEKERIFNELYKIGYIEQRKNNAKTNMKICYLHEDSEIEIVISDFKDVVYKYILWKNKDMIACEGCGKPITPTSPNKKYCGNCAKEILQEQWKQASFKYYHKVENPEDVDVPKV